MDDVEQVQQAAAARAQALARGDTAALTDLLHPSFVWTSHRGEVFDRDAYLAANSGAGSRWLAQQLDDVRVVVAGDAAVLVAVVRDEVEGSDGAELFRMPVTQTWVREAGRWRCLAGHAGPRR